MPEPISTTTALVLGAGAGTVGSSALSAFGAGKAADAQIQGSKEAMAAHRRGIEEANSRLRNWYEAGRRDLAPWAEGSKWAVPEIEKQYGNFPTFAGPGDFEESPGYQFRMDEGVSALERSAAARGMLGSGAAAKEMTRYGQDYGSNEYDKFIDRYYRASDQKMGAYMNRMDILNQVASGGQDAATNLAKMAIQTGSGMSNNLVGGSNIQAQGLMDQGNARASGYINQTNAATSGLNKLTEMMAMGSKKMG